RTARWFVASSGFDAANKRRDIKPDFKTGVRFDCPECKTAGCAVHDTVVEQLHPKAAGPGTDLEHVRCPPDLLRVVLRVPPVIRCQLQTRAPPQINNELILAVQFIMHSQQTFASSRHPRLQDTLGAHDRRCEAWT